MRSASCAPAVALVAALLAACGAPQTKPAADAGIDEPEYDGGLPPDAGLGIAAVKVKPDPDALCLNGCLNIEAGESRKFVAVLEDANGEELSGIPVHWSTDDEGLAAIDADGVVETKAAGSVAIIATAEGVTGQVTLHIKPARVALITITPNPTTAPVGGSTQLTAVAEDEKGNVLTDVTFEWSSGNPLVATVDAQGVVTGVRGGHTVIFATSPRGFTSGWATVEITSSTAPPAGFVLSAMSFGAHHGCGLAAGGKAYCWGWNYFGQMGVGRLDHPTASFPVPEAVLTSKTFAALEVGANHSCALEANGAAWCWGSNVSGQLGTHENLMEVGGTVVPYPVLGSLTFKSLGAGRQNTCGITTDDSLYCWGLGSDGVVGHGSLSHEPTPTPVQSTRKFKQVVVGLGSACALDSSGKAWCWGRNHEGQLGTQEAPSGHVMHNEPREVWGGLVFEKLALDGSHVCALDAMGAAWCWGENTFGQLGDGTLQRRSAPVQVMTPVRFTDIAVGAHHSCGLTSGGDVYCWGNNSTGQLGDGTMQDRLVPQAVIGGHKFTTIHAANSVSCGLNTDGEAMCWGSAYTGESAGGISGGMFVAPWPMVDPSSQQ